MTGWRPTWRAVTLETWRVSPGVTLLALVHSDMWRVSAIIITVRSHQRHSQHGVMPQWVSSYHQVNCYHPTLFRFLLSEKTSYHFKNYGAQDATSQWVEQQSFINENNNNNNSRPKGSKWHQLNSLVVERQESQNISLQPDRVTVTNKNGESRGLFLLPSRRIRQLEDKDNLFGSFTDKKDVHKDDVVTNNNNKQLNNHSSSSVEPIGPRRNGHASLGNFLRDSYQNENIR